MKRKLFPKADPKVGDEIYVPTGNDVTGGLGKIIKVIRVMSAGKKVPFVEVKEQPGISYNWPILAAEQGELSCRYGKSRAYRDGYRPE